MSRQDSRGQDSRIAGDRIAGVEKGIGVRIAGV